MNDTMQDICVPLQEDDVNAVCLRMDAWWVQQNLDPLLLRKVDHDLAGPQHVSERVAARVYAMDKHYGRRTLDAWWHEEGRVLLWDTEKNVPRPEGARLLMRAVVHRQQRLAFWALDKGWSPHTYSSHVGGLTPLHLCVKGISSKMPNQPSHLQLFERLLTPLTVNYQPALEKETAIAVVVQKGHRWHKDQDCVVKMFDGLLEAGADVTLPDHKGWTPFHTAVGRAGLPMPAREALLTRLLKAGANPFAYTKEQDDAPALTPLALLETFKGRREATEIQALSSFLQKAMRQFEARTLATTLNTPGQGPTFSPGRPRL